MTHAERPASRPQSDLSTDQLRREIDRTLFRLFSPASTWIEGERLEAELYFSELITEVLERLP